MLKSFFINEAFDKAIKDYLNSKNNPDSVLFNSFLVVVIRMLINIYSELDIINPYQIKDEEAFTQNLMKFNATKEDIDYLKRLVDGFYVIEKRNQSALKKEFNIYFIAIQKKLIDLFNLKRLNFGLTENDSKEFFDLLYTPGTSNYLRLSYNFKEAEDVYEVAEYYKNAMKKESDIKDEKKNLLGFDVYKLFNLSIADISKMNKDEVNNINKQIYSAFGIKENAINKDYLLEEKIKNYKINNEPLTTGNGYVDILLIMSVIITTIMVIYIFGTLVF